MPPLRLIVQCLCVPHLELSCLKRSARTPRWAARYARRPPILALAVTATLAVSIAAATTAFGLATAVLWRALPFDEASRLVFVWEEVERGGQRHPSRVTSAIRGVARHVERFCFDVAVRIRGVRHGQPGGLDLGAWRARVRE